MPKVTTIFEVQGTLGNVTFNKTKHGLIAKKRTSLSKKRMMTAP